MREMLKAVGAASKKLEGRQKSSAQTLSAVSTAVDHNMVGDIEQASNVCKQ